MQYTLSVYEKAMPNALDWPSKLEAARAAGFDALELSIDESDQRLARLDWAVRERQALIAHSRALGVRLNTMCLSAHRKFPIGGQATERQGLAIMQKAIGLAADLGIRIIQLAGYDVYYEPSTPETRGRFERNLALCASMAAAHGVMLGFETMETEFMNTAAKAMRYVRAVGSPYLGVYPDIGNISNGTDAPIADLESARGHIFAAHLKETRPGVFRDLKFGEGAVDFDGCIRALAGMGVRMYNAEFWYDGKDDWASVMAASNRFLRKYLDKYLTARDQ